MFYCLFFTISEDFTFFLEVNSIHRSNKNFIKENSKLNILYENKSVLFTKVPQHMIKCNRDLSHISEYALAKGFSF